MTQTETYPGPDVEPEAPLVDPYDPDASPLDRPPQPDPEDEDE